MRVLTFVLIGLSVIAGLLVYLRPATTPEAAPAAAPPQAVELVVQRGHLVAGPPVIRVRQGEQVTIRITADASDEFHLHGYDREAKLVAERPATISFVADRSGRFEYELHHSHAALGVLEVVPQ